MDYSWTLEWFIKDRPLHGQILCLSKHPLTPRTFSMGRIFGVATVRLFVLEGAALRGKVQAGSASVSDSK